MTKEETLELLKSSNKQYEQDIHEARNRRDERNGVVLNKWASDNARFNVGDIIESNNTIIQVKKRIGRHSTYYGNMPLYVEYRGPQLTKKLQPRKDENIASIYDDGREINKIEIKQEAL